MMEERTIKYLKESTMGAATSEMVNACFERFKARGWDLTEAELLQIANNVPTCEPEIYMIIEQCEARFNEGDIKDILAVIRMFQPLSKLDERYLFSNCTCHC